VFREKAEARASGEEFLEEFSRLVATPHARERAYVPERAKREGVVRRSEIVGRDVTEEADSITKGGFNHEVQRG